MRDDSLYNSFVEKSKNNDFVLDKGLFLIEKIDDKVDFALEFYKRVDFIFNELQIKYSSKYSRAYSKYVRFCQTKINYYK